jgi:hypothetical protein
VRRGTSSEWAAANPVLASGEPGLDTTLGVFKIGDGSTPWLSLAMAYASTATAANLQAQISNLTPTPWTPFPYTTGWSAYGGYEVPGYRRVGDNVQFRGLVTAAAGVTTTLCTLPVGFRPPTSNVLTWCHSSLSPYLIRVDVLPTGVITIQTATVGNWYAMSSVPMWSLTP